MKSRGIVKSFLVEGDNRLILVDTEFSDADADIIMDGIKDMGRKHEELKLCVLTHRHGDHTGGLKKLKKDIEVSGHGPRAGHAGDTEKHRIRRGVRREGRRNDSRLWWHSSITHPRPYGRKHQTPLAAYQNSVCGRRDGQRRGAFGRFAGVSFFRSTRSRK